MISVIRLQKVNILQTQKKAPISQTQGYRCLPLIDDNFILL